MSEILVADTDSESGSEAGNFENYFEQEEDHHHHQQQASAEIEWWITNLGTTSRKEHKYLSFCRSSKSCEKRWGSTHQDSSPLSVLLLLLFFTEIFHLLVEQTNVYYQQHLDRQAGPSHRLPDITLPDMTTFIALALQMGHELKDTLHDYWVRLRQLHNPFHGKTMARDRFLHILRFLHFADNWQETWRRRRIWPTMENKDCLWQDE